MATANTTPQATDDSCTRYGELYKEVTHLASGYSVLLRAIENEDSCIVADAARMFESYAVRVLEEHFHAQKLQEIEGERCDALYQLVRGAVPTDQDEKCFVVAGDDIRAARWALGLKPA